MSGRATGASTHDEMQSAGERFMARALDLAALGLYTTHPNPRVGCVLVHDDQVIGEGWHARAGDPHAEVFALRAAGPRAQGATAYVTLEPCSHTGRTPPCADALIAAGVSRVVCAVLDPNPKVAGGGVARLRAAGIDVSMGSVAHADAARALNVGFFSRFERGRPFVRLKLAMSLDARTTPAGGGQRWITGDGARADVQIWRARSSAVLTGAGTVRVDDPRLDVRLDYGPWVRQPLRVLLDADLSCGPAARLFNAGHAVVFAAADGAAAGAAAAGGGQAGGGAAGGGNAGGRDPAVSIERVPRAARGLDLRAVLERLAALEVNELLVECGPRLAGSFLESRLVDELILYVAPLLMGADAAPLAHLNGSVAESLPRFEFREQRLIQDDLRLVLTPKRD
jgi:diaminohydroxyphosphoribosylaminopyrimidine deaminase / 5-amino-6-(5-phosphoribosylamino)uracil reductase